jgi:hypothetical protein
MSHPPQLFGSVSMSVQPFRQHWSLPVQTGPPLQEAGAVQLPPTQVSPAGQAKPHWLQFCGSVFTSVQPVPQHWSTPVHPGPPLHCSVTTQWPETHARPAPHFWSQPPQSSGLLDVSTHPAAQHAAPPVQAGPPWHETGASHVPSAQLSLAAQTWVQLPQWVGSTFVFTHVSPQHTSPPEQPLTWQPLGGWHAPPTQASRLGHARPQLPQSFGSVPSSMHPPPQQLRSEVHALPPAQDGTHSRSLQMSPFGHWFDCVQPTHWPVAVSQMGLLAGHWALRVQPEGGRRLHVWVAVLHASPVGQVSGFVRQPTQTPCGSSQNGVLGVVAHSSLDVQPECPPSAAVPSSEPSRPASKAS